MKYFWQFFAVILGLSGVVILFFVLSIPVRNDINFTNEKTVTVPEITSADPQLGPANAKVTLVEYSDYQCPGCVDFEKTLQTLRTNYGTSLRIVWKDMPNSSLHKEAVPAAVAARCAGKQNKFWEFHDMLFANQSQLNEQFYLTTASNLGLKTSAFSQCLTNQDTLALVERGYDEGMALHVPATPTIFLNGERYTGTLTTSDLTHKIDAILNAM